jgi:hypothetical protein
MSNEEMKLTRHDYDRSLAAYLWCSADSEA